MAGVKVPSEFQLNEDHIDWLKAKAREHGLPDEHKALRVLIDYAMDEGDDETIFQTIRCKRC